MDPREVAGSLSATEQGDFAAAAAIQRDAVQCSVFAPKEANVGDLVLVQVFAHLREQAEEADALAFQFDDTATLRARKALATEIARGATLSFELRMRNLEVADAVQEILWQGEPEGAQFEVFIPEGIHPGNSIGVVTVSQDSVPIGQIKFVTQIVVNTAAAPPRELGDSRRGEQAVGEAKRFQHAFISYASADRAEVVRRVQMLRAVGIKCFQDVLELDPGDRWEKELYHHIDESDVIFLFWSTAAKESEWVEREWRYGLERKGDESIQPVPIELPVVGPPPELAHLHFNDRILYFLTN